jgi:hypothetical protein
MRTKSDSYGNRSSESYSYTYRDGSSEPDPNADLYSNTYPDIYSDAYTDSRTEPDANT